MRKYAKLIRPGFLCWAVEKLYRLNNRVEACDEDVPSSLLTVMYFYEYPYDRYGAYDA